MVHLVKLAVGVRDVAQLRALQERRRAEGTLWHLTRHAPRRVAELLDGGSIYWVMDKLLCARQRLTGLEPAQRADGSACAKLLLDPLVQQVAARAVRPFQGWRYLEDSDAPTDLPDLPASAGDLPERLVRELRSLALL